MIGVVEAFFQNVNLSIFVGILWSVLVLHLILPTAVNYDYFSILVNCDQLLSISVNFDRLFGFLVKQSSNLIVCVRFWSILVDYVRILSTTLILAYCVRFWSIVFNFGLLCSILINWPFFVDYR